MKTVYMPIKKTINGCDNMTMKDYETLIASRMRQPRFKHSKNVAKEAVRLAKKYGADV